MKSFFKIQVTGVFLSLVTIGCTGGSSIFGTSDAQLTSLVGTAINRYIANPSGLTASDNIVKNPSARPGWFVTIVNYSNGSFVYTALNTNEWINEANSRGLTVSQFVNDYFAGYISIPSWEQDQFYILVNPIGGNLYRDIYGNLYDSAGAAEKDLETLQVVNEEIALQTSGRSLSAEFGLSEEQGFRVARLAKEWQTISQSRQMTPADLEAFSEDLSGMKVSELRNAAKLAAEGDKSSADDLIKKAAANLDTTPENMKVILDKIVRQ